MSKINDFFNKSSNIYEKTDIETNKITFNSLSKMKVSELKKMCKERKLLIKGKEGKKKDELIERILMDENKLDENTVIENICENTVRERFFIDENICENTVIEKMLQILK